jgi:hypothetical protein
MIDGPAHEREVVVRDRKLNSRILVWTLIVGFVVDGEARSIAGYRRTYNGATIRIRLILSVMTFQYLESWFLADTDGLNGFATRSIT